MPWPYASYDYDAMTPEEQQMLTDLANRIQQTPAPAHDPEAEEFIRTHIGSRPDALYLMTQTVLIQNLALQQAKQQIDELQRRAQQPGPGAPAGGSFLGGAQPAPPQSWGSAQGSAPPPPPPPYYGGAPAAQMGGGHSFLRSAATTAAGVAAGALAFEGISALLGGGPHFGGGFGGGMPGSSFLGNAPGETVVNNYYDSPQDSDREDRDDQNDRGDQDSDVSDNTADDSGTDDSGSDDGGSDDSGTDDSGGFDSGDGGDGGGGSDFA